MRIPLTLILIASSLRSYSSFDYQEQDQKVGLTFIKLSEARISYDSYTMLYYIDISEYKKLTRLVETFIDNSTVLCSHINGDSCGNILRHVNIGLNYMRRNELDIEAYQQKQSKTRRAIEIIGKALHWAYGLMTAETAREYNYKIENLKNDSTRFFNIIEDQTALIKEVIEINNKTASDFQKSISSLRNYIKTYVSNGKKWLDGLHSENVFSRGIQLATLIMTQHAQISREILKCLEDVISGKITQLVPKDRLQQDLLKIESQLKDNQRLPINFNIENPLHIFKYSQVASSLYGEQLLMELTIPIIEREVYTVYKIIPTPTKIENHTIIINPVFHYILLNNEAKEYIPISIKEFNQGQFNLHGEKILKPAENARIDYSDNCEISIFMNPNKEVLKKYCDIKIIPNSNYFIPLNNNDMFYVLISKPIIVTEYCHNQPSKFREIKSSGILQINKECRVVTDKISLRPRWNYRFESKEVLDLGFNTINTTFESIFEKINFLSNITIPDIDENILIQDYSADYKQLIEKADKVIEKNNFNREWSNFKWENAGKFKKSYSFFGSSLLIIIILIAIVIWFFYSRFFSLSTWTKLAKKLASGNLDEIPPLFVRHIPEINEPPPTFYPVENNRPSSPSPSNIVTIEKPGA
ncbi:uncharacterized protein LOC116349811 [Contarinia nasturtii]|uniref:uncharacterized protein LOC116349811 n=1 Tax=Contarinia nasturtii TaxID=265458 RepID=UPI0012D3D072|nr:uncharacterized protein LOC116349811 [Contarinia nasturtii]